MAEHQDFSDWLDFWSRPDPWPVMIPNRSIMDPQGQKRPAGWRFVPKTFQVVEARVRQEFSCLIDGIESVDRFGKGSYATGIFPGSEREQKPTADGAHPMDFSEMGEWIMPEIRSVHGVDAIERLVRIRNLLTAGSPHLDLALGYSVTVECLSHLNHCL